MTVMEFLGCSLIAFGPPFSLLVFTIANNPVRIIILFASAFFWLISLFISSLWWTLIFPLKTLTVFGLVSSVLFQEFFRYLLYVILKKAESGLKKLPDGNLQLWDVGDNKHVLSYVSGLGFGIMSGAFAFMNVLADSLGPGTIGLRKDQDTPLFFVASALTTLCFILLNTCWGLIFFHALDSRKHCLLGYVVISHLTASILTVMNTGQLYWATILFNYLILFLSVWIAYRSAGGRHPRNISYSPIGDSQLEVPLEVMH